MQPPRQCDKLEIMACKAQKACFLLFKKCRMTIATAMRQAIKRKRRVKGHGASIFSTLNDSFPEAKEGNNLIFCQKNVYYFLQGDVS